VNERDAALQLAYTGMHPERRMSLCIQRGGSSGVLAAIAKGSVAMPDAAVEASRVPAHRRLEALAEAGTTALFLGDPGYPSRLAELANPPAVLFVAGHLPTAPGVAIVGTRKPTGYGVRLAERFGRALARDGRTVVSGLARGIDAAAHRGVVDEHGRGVAVLGNGVDRWYPAVNRPLGERLLNDGAVISEYPPGTRPSAWRFPPRNRIIVGLASIVLVVEAGMPGGAMITARMAVDEHRELFAVPGDIGRGSSVGCNLLIRDGAWPVLGVDDLREAVDRVLGPVATPRARTRESALLHACDAAGTPIDELAVRRHQTVADLLVEITELELAGLVRFDGGWVIPS